MVRLLLEDVLKAIPPKEFIHVHWNYKSKWEYYGTCEDLLKQKPDPENPHPAIDWIASSVFCEYEEPVEERKKGLFIQIKEDNANACEIAWLDEVINYISFGEQINIRWKHKKEWYYQGKCKDFDEVKPDGDIYVVSLYSTEFMHEAKENGLVIVIAEYED